MTTRRHLLLLAAVTLLSILVHLNTLGGDFVWDDRALILDDRAVTSWSHLGEIFTNDYFARGEDDIPYGYYRPLTTVSYMLDCTIWGLRPFGYHLTNVLLHAACSVLATLILLRLNFGLTASAVGGLLFAVHPIHTESVAWIAGRTDLVAFVFCAIALLLHLEAARRPRARRMLLALSVGAFAMGLLAKEMSVVLVAWMGLIQAVGCRRAWRAARAAVWPYLAVLAAYVVWRLVVIRVGVPDEPPQHQLFSVLLSSGPTMARYLSWMALPINLNAYVQNPYVTSALDPRFVGAVVVLIAVGFVLQRLTRHADHVPLAAGMLVTSFIPILNLVRVAGPADMGNVMAERFCYFPSFPFLALVGLAVSAAFRRTARIPALRSFVRSGVAVAVALGALGTVTRNGDWRDELTFLTTTLRQSPTAVTLWGNLANYHLGKKNLEAAQDAIQKGAAIDPNGHAVLSARVLWYVVSGRFADAIPVQERIVREQKRGETGALNNLAYLFRMTGQETRALSILEQLVREGRGYADVYFNLAEIHRARGQTEAARSEYRQALDGHPSDLRTANALAELEVESGRRDEAEAIYRQVLKLYPKDVRILNNIALIWHDKGDVAGALGLLARIVELRPSYAKGRINYAELLEGAGRIAEATFQLEEAVRVASGTELETVAAQRLAAIRSATGPAPANADRRLEVMPGSAGRDRGRASPPAVVLVTVDTLRADAVSFNGHQPQTTPFLDTLDRNGVVFTEAYSPSSWTVPSMASLFTGLTPSVHGIVAGLIDQEHDRQARVVRQQVLPGSLTTLAESFQQAGYVTIGVPANLHLAANLGFAQGFDHYGPAGFKSAPEVNQQVLIQLERAYGPEWQTAWKHGKTFLWIHYFDPHDPYEAREPWISRYAPEFTRDAPDFPAGVVMKELKLRYPTPDADLAARIKPLYESEISFFDDHFRRLSEQLGLDDDVLLIVTADHGEEIADHGAIGHGQSLYQEVVHVPLLVRWPAGVSGGARIDSPVSLLDVYPTLAELAGLPAPPGLQGGSLVPLLRGESRSPRVLYFELHAPRRALKAVRDGAWKLIREQDQGGEVRLFNLVDDAGERRDVAAQQPEVVVQLQAALSSWLDALPPPAADTTTVPLQDEGVKEHLRALGYLH